MSACYITDDIVVDARREFYGRLTETEDHARRLGLVDAQ